MVAPARRRTASSSVRSGLVVIVVADGGLVNAVMLEQLAALPGVLASDQVHLPEHPHGAIRDVLEISDGGGDHIQEGGHILSIGANACRQSRLDNPKSLHCGRRKSFGMSMATAVQFSVVKEKSLERPIDVLVDHHEHRVGSRGPDLLRRRGIRHRAGTGGAAQKARVACPNWIAKSPTWFPLMTGTPSTFPDSA